MKFRELSKKEVREILEKLSLDYGIDKKLLESFSKSFCWFSNKEGKIYIAYKTIKNYLKFFNVQRFGLYIGKREKTWIRLSIEGSQLFGPYITKNILKVDANTIFRSRELEIEEKSGFYVMKDEKDFCGSCFIKNNRLKTFISKSRRILAGRKDVNIEEELSKE
jgi:NOL1/NOP2/fmu family ribosome biogenesis protein